MAQQALLDLLDENLAYVNWILDETPEECLHWLTDPGANSMSVTLWHCARALDVFKTLHVENLPDGEELWIKNGWVEKTGYDPRGIGTHGWGQLTGYTQAEVAAIPRFDEETLRQYTQEVLAEIKSYLVETPEEELMGLAPGYDGKQTRYFWIRHPLFDMARHLGEVLAIWEMWKRGRLISENH